MTFSVGNRLRQMEAPRVTLHWAATRLARETPPLVSRPITSLARALTSRSPTTPRVEILPTLASMAPDLSWHPLTLPAPFRAQRAIRHGVKRPLTQRNYSGIQDVRREGHHGTTGAGITTQFEDVSYLKIPCGFSPLGVF